MNISLQTFHIAKSLFTPLLDFLYPPLCISCSKLIEGGGSKVCESCWQSIQHITPDHPLLHETRNRLLETGVIGGLVSPFVFTKEGAFQHIAHALKYGSYESLGRELGRRLGEKARENRMVFDLVVPVPLHPAKLRDRGYNQAALIAEGMVERAGGIVADIVRRVRYTETQTKLNLEQRRSNMRDAFALKADGAKIASGRSIMVVDDVITTGSTIVACACWLKRAGAETIVAGAAALASHDAAI